MKKYITLLVVLTLSIPTLGAITAYNNYDAGTAPWTYSVDPGLAYSEQGVAHTHLPAGNGSYPAGNPAFGGCVDLTPQSDVLYYATDTPAWESVHNYLEGTMEAWVAPHWAGEGQGGDNPNATYQFVFNPAGAGAWNGPVQLYFMDNNWYVEPGYQLMGYWNDGTQSQGFEGYSNGGKCYDWTADSWHHVAISWDASTIGIYMDGSVVHEVARTNINPNMFASYGNGGYLYGWTQGGVGPVECFDGAIDDTVISSHAKYTPGNGGNTGAGTYTMPTAPAPEPTTIALLGLGALALLRKRS